MQLKKQHQNIIMIIIVIFTMIIFCFFVNHFINKTDFLDNYPAIDLTPRPIEELFASEFKDLEKTNLKDQSDCNAETIIQKKNQMRGDIKIYGTEINIPVNNNCSWTYEDDSFNFNFKNYNNSIFFSSEVNNTIRITDYTHKREDISFRKNKNTQGIEQYIDNYINKYYGKKLEQGDESLKDIMGGSPSTLIKIRHYKNNQNISIYHIFLKRLVWTGTSSEELLDRGFFVVGFDDVRLDNINGEPKLLKDFLSSIKIK